MKDASRETFESARPAFTASHAVEFCLEKLYADPHKRTMDEVAQSLTYEELIGALLLARDAIAELESLGTEV